MHHNETLDHTDVRMMGGARVPTEFGEFRLCLYQGGGDDKEHLALVHGEVAGSEGVLTRLHSECFTGDVMGSLRCDCGPQLHSALRMIAQAGRGVVVYLRQEGRGIGLLNKLRAYNLQDQGYDTVDANLKLGFAADAREYGTAALILRHLGVRSIDLITNNPRKIDGLALHDVPVRRRLALEVPPNAENLHYLSTKVARMDHMLALAEVCDAKQKQDEVDRWLDGRVPPSDRPMVTLSYAQSLDGSIAREAGKQLALSGEASMLLTHRLRAWHDAILVGIGTVLSDDPRLTVRLVDGQSPRPVVVDSTLRIPLDARMLANERRPWVVTGPRHDPERRRALEARDVNVIEVTESDGGIDLEALLTALHARGIQRLMVEGGARILNAFLRRALVDSLIVTVAPTVVGGIAGIERGGQIAFPELAHSMWHKAGQDMVLFASTR